MFREEHLYIVAYDIRDPKRWRRVFRLMNGYGEWLQLSMFQCRLSVQRHAELIALLDGIIHHKDDHLVLLDLGPAERVVPRVVSLGRTFTPVTREPVIV
jgi:CRISPR-associated protein Cas2